MSANKKKRNILWTLLPIALIAAGIVLVALPMLENQRIEQAQSDVVSVLEEMGALYRERPSAPNATLKPDETASPTVDNPAVSASASAPMVTPEALPSIREEMVALAEKVPEINVSDEGRVFVDMDINTDEEVGIDAFIDPESGEEIKAMPELGALDADKLRVEIIARIYIPSIECYYYVADGSGKTELKNAIGHWKSSAYVGDMGNAVFPGHRNYTYGQYFNRLDELKEGDTIEIFDMQDNRYVYEVDRVFLVEPKDLYANLMVLPGEEMERRITLSTCHPVRVASHRLMVQGKLIEGPEWTLSDAYPLNPDRVDEEALAAKVEELAPHHAARLFSGILPNMRSLVGRG